MCRRPSARAPWRSPARCRSSRPSGSRRRSSPARRSARRFRSTSPGWSPGWRRWWHAFGPANRCTSNRRWHTSRSCIRRCTTWRRAAWSARRLWRGCPRFVSFQPPPRSRPGCWSAGCCAGGSRPLSGGRWRRWSSPLTAVSASGTTWRASTACSSCCWSARWPPSSTETGHAARCWVGSWRGWRSSRSSPPSRSCWPPASGGAFAAARAAGGWPCSSARRRSPWRRGSPRWGSSRTRGCGSMSGRCRPRTPSRACTSGGA